jgi:hypothetical protein
MDLNRLDALWVLRLGERLGHPNGGHHTVRQLKRVALDRIPSAISTIGIRKLSGSTIRWTLSVILFSYFKDKKSGSDNLSVAQGKVLKI